MESVKPCDTCSDKYRDYAGRERCHVFCDFIKNLPPTDTTCEAVKQAIAEDQWKINTLRKLCK